MPPRHVRPSGTAGSGFTELSSGIADFAVFTKESLISLSTRTDSDAQKNKLVAIASIPQAVTHALVSLKSSSIDSPAKMSGRKYYKLGGRTHEAGMVSAMIKNDGGSGEWEGIESPDNMTYLDTLLENFKGQVDFLWMFMNWEGVLANRAGHELNIFEFEDYKVPYGFSPIIVAHSSFLEKNPKLVQDFLAATEKGFQYLAAHPVESAAIVFKLGNQDSISKPLKELLDLDMLIESCTYMSTRVLDANGRWGRMKPEWWNDLLDWLNANKMLDNKTSDNDENYVLVSRDSIKADDLFTNKYFV
ncbi:hypothetical protein HK100_009192 [Physocladia obscura]|uniref:4-amino-5-hydroxymethyl-2-methylpyrimidine phosphate synthase n=1 Tax=Physocladia obscura TaxID=109957 RepID=A0AAD5XI44_9FUNG|nr:hypothetical protein HK100_009192 [Physocladia obscura]